MPERTTWAGSPDADKTPRKQASCNRGSLPEVRGGQVFMDAL